MQLRAVWSLATWRVVTLRGVRPFLVVLVLVRGSLRIFLCPRFLVEASKKETPLVVFVRGHLDSVKGFMKGDYYIGRGCRQRSLGCSLFAIPFKVAKHGRDCAIELFAKHLDDDVSLRSSIWILSGLRLLCHCGPLQSCHDDVLITAFAHNFPGAYDSHDTSASVPPTSAQLNYLAALREEPDSSEGSSADEEAKASGVGWTRTGKPMQIGVGYTVRDFCDGQSLASRGAGLPPRGSTLARTLGHQNQNLSESFRNTMAPRSF